jgi:glycoside/pentoside/hexuronide:cation symporter, GPH family
VDGRSDPRETTMKQPKEFHWYEGLVLLLTCIAIQLISEVQTQWGTFFYSPPEDTGRPSFTPIALGSLMFVITYIFSACTDPIIAMLSDRTRTEPGRWRLIPISGRRRPFIFWGSLGVTVTGILFWHPPVGHQSTLNFVYATIILCIHWGIFSSMCYVPFNSLPPEIARSQQARVKIGTWVAAGMILGLAIAEISPGILVRLLDAPAAVSPTATPAASTTTGEAPASPVGYQRTAVLFAIVSLAFFQLCVWTVRERYRSTETSATTPPVRVIIQTLSNTVFLKYLAIFFLFNLGYLAVQRVLPYWVTVGLGGTEETVSKLMIPYIICAIASLGFTSPLSRYVPIKWMMFISLGIITTGLPMMYFIGVAHVSSDVKFILGAVLFSYCGIGQGMQYILLTPMIGEIIDYDEMKSGERREAIYQSVSGLSWKASQALSVGVMGLSLQLWGRSADHPLGIYLVGPIAGVFGILGMIVCWYYPVLHVTRETPAPSVGE